MCRIEAQEIWAQAHALKAAGASRIVALVKEDLDSEVSDFRAKFWGGEVLLDADQKFYAALGGGAPWKPFNDVKAFMAMVGDPESKSRTKAAIAAMREAKVENNKIGEGFVSGGLYVIAANGQPMYSFLEEEMGVKAPAQEILVAVSKAASLG